MDETIIVGAILLTMFVTTFILVINALETDRMNRRIKQFKKSKMRGTDYEIK